MACSGGGSQLGLVQPRLSISPSPPPRHSQQHHAADEKNIQIIHPSTLTLEAAMPFPTRTYFIAVWTDDVELAMQNKPRLSDQLKDLVNYLKTPDGIHHPLYPHLDMLESEYNILQRFPHLDYSIAPLPSLALGGAYHEQVGVIGQPSALAHATDRNLRILFLATDSKDEMGLHAGTEYREVMEKLGKNGKITVDFEPACRVDDLLVSLAGQPDLLHMSMHSGADGVVCFQGSDNRSVGVGIEKASKILRLAAVDDHLKAVVLNFCHSANMAEGVSLNVGIAIGMTGPVTNEHAIAFSKAFYTKLANQEENLMEEEGFKKAIKKAFNWAKVFIGLLSNGAEPVLFDRGIEFTG